VDRFDANTYLLITKTLDYFDPAADFDQDLSAAFTGRRRGFWSSPSPATGGLRRRVRAKSSGRWCGPDARSAMPKFPRNTATTLSDADSAVSRMHCAAIWPGGR
jgi:hypothetical protein